MIKKFQHDEKMNRKLIKILFQGPVGPIGAPGKNGFPVSITIALFWRERKQEKT